MKCFQTIQLFLLSFLLLVGTSNATNVSGVGDVNGDGYEDFLQGTETSVLGGALNFNGTNQYGTINLTYPVGIIQQERTFLGISFWFYPRANSGTLLTIGNIAVRNDLFNGLSNRWNHFYFERNSVYINGKLVQEFASQTPTQLVIGARLESGVFSNYFNGQIADIQVLQVLSEYTQDGKQHFRTIGLVDFVQQPSMNALPYARGVFSINPLITNPANNRVTNSVVTSYTELIPPTGDLLLTNGVTAGLPLASSAPLAADLGALNYWNFEAVTDSRITEQFRQRLAFSGTLTSSATVVGKVGNAVAFTSDANDAMTFTSNYSTGSLASGNIDLPTGDESFTTAFWINPTVSNPDNRVLHWGTAFVSNASNGVQLIGTQLRSFFWANDLDTPINSIQNNRWTHVAITYDKATKAHRIYLDGVLSVSRVVTVTPNVAQASLIIGESLVGQLDELSIYRRALTATEVDRLVKSTTGNLVPVAANNDVLLTLGGPSGGSIFLRGSVDRGRTGWSLSGLGDFNGDGFNDFAIGAPHADSNGLIDTGAAYVVYGRSNFESNEVVELNGLSGSNGFQIVGTENYQYVGYSLSGAGDPNRDGLRDLIVGAPGTTVSGSRFGAAYLLFGNQGGAGSGGLLPINVIGSNLDKGLSGTRMTVLDDTGGTVVKNYNIGFSVSGVGDYNGDGYDDVAVSMPMRRPAKFGNTTGHPGEGEVFLAFGRPFTAAQTTNGDNEGIGKNGNLDLSKPIDGANQRGVSFNGGDNGDSSLLGTQIKGLGDLDSDGYSDFAILTIEKNSDKGARTLFVYGEPNPEADGFVDNLVLTNNDLGELSPNRGALVLDSANFGGVSGAGDFNGDGKMDLAFGLPTMSRQSYFSGTGTINSNSQERLVGYSSLNAFPSSRFQNGSTTQLNFNLTQTTSRFEELGAGLIAGTSVSAADLSGDAVPDLITGRQLGGAKSSASAAPTAVSGLFRNAAPQGFGERLGELQIWRDIASVPVGDTGTGQRSLPSSLVSVGFQGGGRGGQTQTSNQQVRLFHQSPPRPYLFDAGGPNQKAFKSLDRYWFLETDRGRFAESTVEFHLPGGFLDSITEAELKTLGVYYSKEDPIAPRRLGATAIWTMDDISGGLIRETISGTTTPLIANVTANTNGRVGGALQLSGNTTEQFLNGGTYPLGAESYSVAFWVNPQRNSGVNQFLFQFGGKVTFAGVGVIIRPNKKISAYWYNNDLDVDFGDERLNKWTHVATTFDGTTRRLYLDGVLVGQDNPVGKNTIVGTPEIGINSCLLDEISIFKRSLSNSEINELAKPKTAFWTPFTETLLDPSGTRLVLNRKHNVATASAAKQDFDGFYALFTGDATYSMGTEIVPPAFVNINLLPASGPIVEPSGSAWWHEGQKKLFAIQPRPTVVINWLNDSTKTSQFTQSASFVWPGTTNAFDASNAQIYEYYVSGSPDFVLDSPRVDGTRIASVTLGFTETNAGKTQVESQKKFSSTTGGRSLLLLSDDDPKSGSLYFAFVWSIPFESTAKLTTTALVGENLSAKGVTLGVHTNDFGAPWFRNKTGYICTDSGYYKPEDFPNTGPIIPVNLDLTSNDASDNFDLVYYKKQTTIYNAFTRAKDSTLPLYAPHKSASFTVSWPTAPSAITITNGLGTGNLPSARYRNPDLYVQNTRLLDPDGVANSGDEIRPFGFNPNEEHAVALALEENITVFPLRHDLNDPATSEPYVLVKFEDLNNSSTPSIGVWKVNLGTTFNFTSTPTKAGSLLLPPQPLRSSLFPPCEAVGTTQTFPNGSHTVNSENVWVDREGRFWAIDAGTTESSQTDVTMRYFYRLQPDFYIPATFNQRIRETGLFSAQHQLSAGDCVPWLSDWKSNTLSARVKPADVTLRIVWPNRNEVPTLFFAETLVEPKRGLPSIEGNDSVEILAEMNGPHAQLIDPTVERRVTLTAAEKTALDKMKLAPSDQPGRFEFEDLSPHLRIRLLYEKSNGLLIWYGKYVQFLTGEDMLLPNVMTSREKTQILGINTDGAWVTAVNKIATASSAIVPIPDLTRPLATRLDADSLALSSANARRAGYLTLGFNNKESANGAVSIKVIYVDDELWKGDAKVIYPDCPFVEEVSLRHNGDFAGKADSYEFDWYYIESARYFDLRTLNGGAELPSPGDAAWGQNGLPASPWIQLIPNQADRLGAVDVTVNQRSVGNDGVLGDLFWTVRYTCRDTNSILNNANSTYAGVALTEGWVKRVIGEFGPLRQRATGGGIQGAEDSFESFRNREVNTIVSMISQAGPRWEGDVPLTCNDVDGLGLIEVYQTVLNRARVLSIDASPPAPASNTVVDTLLLAASRTSDLYTLLGNEAFADATDPTLVFSGEQGNLAFDTSLHAFMNQVPTLLEEELGLLRGRDNTSLPAVNVQPVYNRLIWNLTSDATGGSLAYGLNYGITSGAVADAAEAYPQGHGDAWGHLLTGIKGYYKLIRSPEFRWIPRREAVLVGGSPVEVDFYDERKFAGVAAAKARVGREVVNLTYRGSYTENPSLQWQGYKDTNKTRKWGVSEWGQKAGMAARLDWITANALLPADNNSTDLRNIAIVHRGTVPELGEIASAYHDIQIEIDRADIGMNPIGLAHDVIPFDIDPSSLSNGADAKTHFEQIFDRAQTALQNASDVFAFAQGASIALRAQADDVGEFQDSVGDAEFEFETRLLELFGTPYPDDIGPSGSYPQGYAGPDLIHFMYIDRNSLVDRGIATDGNSISITTAKGYTVAELESNEQFDYTNNLQNPPVSTSTQPKTIQYSISADQGSYAPATWTRPRVVSGQLQLANLNIRKSMTAFNAKVTEYSNYVKELEDEVRLFRTRYNILDKNIKIQTDLNNASIGFDTAIAAANTAAGAFEAVRDTVNEASEAAAEAAPTSVGLANDIGAGVRAAVGAIRAGSFGAMSALMATSNALSEGLQVAKGTVERNASLDIQVADSNLQIQESLAALRSKYLEDATRRLELVQLSQDVQQAIAEYSSLLGSAERILEERARFRQLTAASTADYRHKDMAYRLFRNEAIQKYRAQYDLAARMVYLAAKSYDYETNMLGSDTQSGESFLTQIVRARSIGKLSADGAPLIASSSGDPGLSDMMARMNLNFQLVIKSQLGFNNPQVEGTRFSLKQELFRIDTDENWRNLLSRDFGNGASSGIVRNILELPEYKRFAIPFAGNTLAEEPGIVIRFGTNINFGQNFFVNLDSGANGGTRPLGGGDSVYSSANFATKIRSVGLWFENYNNLNGSGMSNTPILYLFPKGVDLMRSPSGDRTAVRRFQIVDQAIPVPFPLGGNQLNAPTWSPTLNSLSESFITIRRYPPFRAYHDAGDSEAELNTDELSLNNRLIGRSVWNSEWYIIIPGGALHSDRYEGLHRFIYGNKLNPQPAAGQTPASGIQINRLDTGASEWRDGNGVRDILLYFQTYAYAGI